MAYSNNPPDDPIIRNMESTGYPDGKEPKYPVCPVCGATADTFYKNAEGEILGCDECIYPSDAWETVPDDDVD